MSTLKVDGIRSNSASSDAITLASDGTCTANITNRTNKNLIINGAFQVAQRGTTTVNQGYFTVDRFKTVNQGVDEAPTRAQGDVASGTTPYNLGFRKCFKITNGNNTSGAEAGDYLTVQTILEAQDIANSGWNYTSASSYITLSFWIKSSVAQNFYGYLKTEDGTEQLYPYETGSLSANTWTKITKTIPGNSNLTFDNNANAGLEINITPFWGTDRTASGVTLNQWGALNASARTPDNTTTWWTTNDATFEVTGFQLEVSDHATDFEHRSFAQELALCQRYCYVWESSVAYSNMGTGVQTDANNVDITVPLPQIMRANPSFSSSGTFRIVGYDSGSQSAKDLSSFSMTRSHSRTPYLRGGISGGTGGMVGEFGDSGANNAKAIFSAEL